jgi:ketosteroid isomerase-like protein
VTSVQTVGSDQLEQILALVEGSSRTHESWLARDVRTWLASPEHGLAAAVDSVSGARASTEALGRLAPSRVTVVGAVASGDACWVEVEARGEGEPETCIAGLTYEPGGGVSRLVWLRAPLVPPCKLDAGDAAPPARPVLEGYFAALMNSRFGEAAAHFTRDTLYSHPPYAGGYQRVLFRGREALRRGFVELRGPSPARQIVTGLWQQGDRVFVEGIIEGIPDGGSFFSTAEISRDGEIARYVAFYSATRIPPG